MAGEAEVQRTARAGSCYSLDLGWVTNRGSFAEADAFPLFRFSAVQPSSRPAFQPSTSTPCTTTRGARWCQAKARNKADSLSFINVALYKHRVSSRISYTTPPQHSNGRTIYNYNAPSTHDGCDGHQCHAYGEYQQPGNHQQPSSAVKCQAHTLRPGLRVNEPLNFIIMPETLSPMDAWRLWWWTGAAAL